MKPTLLDLTQSILSSMDGDEINSISDTTESLQVVDLIKQTYFDHAALYNLPRDYNTFQLNPSNDSDKPVSMSLPTDIASLEWIKYDVQTTDDTGIQYRTILPLSLEDFLAMVMALDEDETYITKYNYTVGADSMEFMCYNDRAPTYYTTTDDGTILFDAFDSTVDTTLQKAKTLAYGQKGFPWSKSDTFVFPLDDKQFQLLLNDAKSLCFAELKQQQHVKAEQRVRQLKINQQSAKTKAPVQTARQRLPNFGRKV